MLPDRRNKTIVLNKNVKESGGGEGSWVSSGQSYPKNPSKLKTSASKTEQRPAIIFSNNGYEEKPWQILFPNCRRPLRKFQSQCVSPVDGTSSYSYTRRRYLPYRTRCTYQQLYCWEIAYGLTRVSPSRYARAGTHVFPVCAWSKSVVLPHCS